MRYRDVGVLTHNRAKASPGFTLIVRLNGRAAYLIDMDGKVVHEWRFPLNPGNNVYLLENGNLLWSGEPKDNAPFDGEALSRFEGGEGHPLRGGRGGILREYDWDGEILWEYENWNSIMIAAGWRTATRCISDGRSCRRRWRNGFRAVSREPSITA